VFRGWADRLAEGVELAVPCLPGRDARAAEPPLTDMAALAGRLADDMETELDQPYALFGHSLGAFVALELARELAARGAPAPELLIVSGQRGPSLPYPHAPIFRLPDDEFLAAVQRRHEAIPAAVLGQPEMLVHFRRLLRADFTLVEDYRYVARAPLPCPILCLRGRDDKFVAAEQVEGWRDETVRHCDFEEVAGGHFYVRGADSPVFDPLNRRLGDRP